MIQYGDRLQGVGRSCQGDKASVGAPYEAGAPSVNERLYTLVPIFKVNIEEVECISPIQSPDIHMKDRISHLEAMGR